MNGENVMPPVGEITTEYLGERIATGKVREIFNTGARNGYETLTLVSTDRISVFDSVLPSLIPGKGQVLTLMSAFWFDKLGDITPNHLIEVYHGPYATTKHRDELTGRAMVVAKTQVVPIEAVVRGYLTGSAWKEYQKSGTVNGIQLPVGMQESQAFPEPLFTPSTKAPAGQHDEPITFEQMVDLVGCERAETIRDLSIQLYVAGRDYALTKGVIIADTKFEWGIDPYGALVLIDELFTPDSSRFWELSTYRVGEPQESLDKQIVRNYVEGLGWDKRQETAPALPEDVIEKVAGVYEAILLRLTEKSREETILEIEVIPY